MESLDRIPKGYQCLCTPIWSQWWQNLKLAVLEGDPLIKHLVAKYIIMILNLSTFSLLLLRMSGGLSSHKKSTVKIWYLKMHGF